MSPLIPFIFENICSSSPVTYLITDSKKIITQALKVISSQLLFGISADADLTYSWVTPTGVLTGQEMSYEIYEDTRFYVTATGVQCSDTASVLIKAIDAFNIPNGFSPNGDGKNDTWNIKGLTADDIEISIYNRWGGLVYESYYAYDNPWDGVSQSGKKLPIATYYYVITSGSDNTLELTGSVTILR